MHVVSKSFVLTLLLLLVMICLFCTYTLANNEDIYFEYEDKTPMLTGTEAQSGGNSSSSGGRTGWNFNIWDVLSNFFDWTRQVVVEFFSSVWERLSDWFSQLSDPIQGLIKGIVVGLVVAVVVVVVVLLLVKFGLIAGISLLVLGVFAGLAVLGAGLYGYIVGGDHFSIFTAALMALGIMLLPIAIKLGLVGAVMQGLSRLLLGLGTRYYLLTARMSSLLGAAFSALRLAYWRFVTEAFMRWTALQTSVRLWVMSVFNGARGLLSRSWQGITGLLSRGWAAVQSSRLGQILSAAFGKMRASAFGRWVAPRWQAFSSWAGRTWAAFKSSPAVQWLATKLTSKAFWKSVGLKFSLNAAAILVFHFISPNGEFNLRDALVDVVIGGLAGVFIGSQATALFASGKTLAVRLSHWLGGSMAGGSAYTAYVYMTQGTVSLETFITGAIVTAVLLPAAGLLSPFTSNPGGEFTLNFVSKIVSEKITPSVTQGLTYVKTKTLELGQDVMKQVQKKWHEWQLNQVNTGREGNTHLKIKDKYDIKAP
ncbi:hypothetical protein J2S00_000655 [Caldalkalibacillus uzonensis]|uniref:Uncharacterized protein n=1 Tax=Caldalkalibacillus uzonensis TaxID=353224 RepID=A0ABU0CNZ9_9BACI|nr:hypothetical protein [Caldalkalibacillus uzonensis]MDQ0337872.1 hypothetical protein [Caldalkalibacillus uzonensis]